MGLKNIDWKQVSFKISDYAAYHPWIEGVGLAARISTMFSVVQLCAAVIPIIANECAIVRRQLNESTDKIDRILIKNQLKILEKKEQIFKELEELASHRIDDEDMPAVREKITILGKKLLRLEKIEDKLEAKKENLRRKGLRGFFSRASMSVSVHLQLRRLDTIEEEIDIDEKQIYQILTEVLAFYGRHKHNPRVRANINRLEKLFAELSYLEKVDINIEAEERVEE